MWGCMGIGGMKDWRDGMHCSVYDKYSVVLDFMKKKTQSRLEASRRKE